MKITRVRFYHVPTSRPIFNQSAHIVTVETDAGITGIGEGGARDTIEQVAGMLIGENPLRIEHLWQRMYRGYFYPPGREKLHAVGALDLALWDIKGKVLGVPVYELWGGLTRDHVECYATAFPSQGTLQDTARACIEAGFRAFRTAIADPGGDRPFHARQMIQTTYEQCVKIHEAVNPAGDWCIDYHTRLDIADAIRLSTLIEDLEPYFAEDLVRLEMPNLYRTLRPQIKIPIAVGEQYGDKWEMHALIEQQLLDYARVTLPNAGGMTEFQKIAALCETHHVGLVPHFTGPVATAALVHCCSTYPGPALIEILGDGPREAAHLPQCLDFHHGKLWPNTRPGLGVAFDPKYAQLIAEMTEPAAPVPLLRRPDGSWTNW